MFETLIADGLVRIRQSFVTGLHDHHEHLVEAQRQIDAGTDLPAALDEARFRAHKIYGTASTLGFEELGRRACECEQLMMRLLDDDAPAGQLPQARDSLALLIDEIARVIETRH